MHIQYINLFKMNGIQWSIPVELTIMLVDIDLTVTGILVPIFND